MVNAIKNWSKKKKVVMAVVSSLLFLAILAVILFKVLGFGGTNPASQEEPADTIVHAVSGVDQVFIDGTVTPTQSQEFIKDPTLGKMGELKVTDGQEVAAGSVLYEYDNTELDSTISELSRSITEQTAARDSAIRQRDLELRQLEAKPLETDPATGAVLPGQDKALERERILLTYNVESMNAGINSLAAQRNELGANKITAVTAPFTGKVFIPQEKTKDSVILKLTSADSYVIGTVNERDIDKIAVDQKCEINVLSNGVNTTGKITYVADQPEGAAESGDGATSGGMAKFTVKMSLDSMERIKNGFHVQAAVSLSEEIITIPSKCVFEEDGKSYVFIDDFGTILKKQVVIDRESEKAKALPKDEVAIKSGLEAEDLVIVSSKKKLHDGDLTPPTKMDDAASADSQKGDGSSEGKSNEV